MRNFVVSIICLGLLIGVWVVFDHYSKETIQGYMDQIDNNIIKTVETEEQWGKAYSDFEALSKDWHKYKKSAAFFLDTEAINDTDYTIARAKYYIKAEDVSNASGELACLKEQLQFLHYNESLSWGNIF